MVNQKQLPETGFVRLRTVLDKIPVSRSLWWQGVRTGRFPSPVRNGRITMWSVQSIRDLITQIERGI